MGSSIQTSPYEILERIGTVAYRLQLPPHSHIHQVLHIFLLKLYYQNLNFHPATLPTQEVDNHPVVQPVAILRSHQLLKNSVYEQQLLIMGRHTKGRFNLDSS